ncbi:MAG: CbiQ family ECF transporter T component [Candidatus Zixiibacteriota bacterium]|jgi:energy-coupling factor transporter transmembrane protein EcfT
MFFEDLDYWATSGRGWLHRVPPVVKLLWLAAEVAALVLVFDFVFYAALYVVLVAFLLTSRVPARRILLASAYPLIFLALVFLSVRGLDLFAILYFSVRVMAVALTVLLIAATTPFPRLLGAVRFLPKFIAAGLFLTYRAIFILADVARDVRTAYRLRGAPGWRRPRRFIVNTGRAVGFIVLAALERSENAAAALRVRGFNGRIYL